jgi:signal transduction histidine kinase
MLAFMAVAAVSVLLARALHRTQARLYRLLDEREDTLAVVSHDLRNPLTRIQLDAALASQSTSLPETLGPRLRRIQETANEMNRFVSDLLLVAQSESGALALQMTEFPIADCLRTAIDRIGPLAEQQNIEVTLKPAEPCVWYGDYDRLLQLVINLLGNAVKYGRPSGHVEVGCEGSESHVTIQVSDDGPGISQADQAHLFERFWTGGRNRKDTGLGLYICKKIVDAHRGRIWVQSDGRTGTTFFVEFPRLKPPDAQQKKPALETNAGFSEPK